MNNSFDSGFRDGNPETITEGEMWDKAKTEIVSGSHSTSISGRTTRSQTARVHANDNAIPGSGRNNPSKTQGPSGSSATGSRTSGPDGSGGGPDPPKSGPTGKGTATGGSDSRNGDGGDPHPGRSVGAGAPGFDSTSTNVGSAALLAKMFSEPLKDPVPSGTHFLPCDSEELLTEREGKGSQYSPVMWADPLIPINFQAGSVASAIDRLPAVGCSVSNRFEPVTPELTQEGTLLKAIVDTEANPTILRSMISVKGMKDLSALICLLETSRRTGFQAMSDEAPLIRLGLLMHCLAPTSWMGYTTSCVQNVCANGYADMKNIKRTWTGAPTDSTKTEIGTGSGCSSLYWRTLGQYARLVSGSSILSDEFVDSANKPVSVESVKFIPVKMSWRGQSWLGPYILAHTTTKWWNHALKVDIPIVVHDLKTAQNKAIVTCMPKAATVYIPGSYKYICLVIVDVVEASFPATEIYYIGNSYTATFTGNHDFGKVGHKIIGRDTSAPSNPATMTDCMAAWKVMCRGLLSHVNPGSIEMRLAVLTTSRFAGFSVWTDSAKPKGEKLSNYASLIKDLDLQDEEIPTSLLGWLDVLNKAADADSDDDDEPIDKDQRISILKNIIDTRFGKDAEEEEDKDHIFGVTCVDPKTDIKIGDHTIPDWFTSYNTTATMPDRVKYYTWWRCDPLHNFSLAQVSCEDASKPVLSKFRSGEIQYEITEATDLVRILSYAGIYQDNSACAGAIVSPIDILNRSLGFGGLLLALTELWRVSSGLSLLDYNKFNLSHKLVDPDQWHIMGAATKGFSIISPNTTNTAWTDKEFKILEVIKTQMGITDPKWLEHWYGGVVPWWYVQAVLVKFGGDVKLITSKCTSVRLDYDNEWLDEEGYHLKAGGSGPADLTVLASSIRYEKKVQRKGSDYFTILTPTRDGHDMKVHWTSWYYNYLNDLPKSGLRRQTRVTPPSYDGVVELNCITFAEGRRYKGYSNPEAFVDKSNRYLLPLDQTVYRGLTWPDPFTDWLKQGLIAIEPHLLNLDVVGAVGAALGHVNKTIIDWLNEKIHGDQSFRD
uniref:Putative capsid protein n=1 Tax=Pisingos virus TaxID=2689339 RepID=A0A6B9KG80_9VIRU|nr:putative capsid protein [Pisingos virus]